MNARVASARQQTGAYLLEALIGMLIFSIGVLGIVGLQATSLRTTSDSALRAEAVFAANKLIGQMWADDQSTLQVNYTSGGAAYTAFAADLKAAQGGSWYQDPDVAFVAAKAPSKVGQYVEVTIYWRSPDGENHQYLTAGVIGENCFTGPSC